MTTETAPAFIGELNSCARREIASIGDLDAAISAEDDPGYVTLFRESKSEKQAAVEQITVLVRMLGGTSTEHAFRPKRVKPEAVGRPMSRALQLEGMRDAETALVDGYRGVREGLPNGFERDVLTAVTERAVKRWHILAAHLARASGDEGAARGLPRPLEEYFATSEDRVCMRCLFDRPGPRKALHRTHPETYVCAACHDEVLAGFPPDLEPQVRACPEDKREALVVERALGRPEALRARKTVIALLSGLDPEDPPAAKEPVDESIEERRWVVESGEATVDVPRMSSDKEADYVQMLFDFRSLSRWW